MFQKYVHGCAQSPTRVSDFRPISLWNVIYKIIAKTIANCLKLVLNKVISDEQNAFVPNRNIVNYGGLLNYVYHKTIPKDSFLALKLDASKAYDGVKWLFLEKIIAKLGFYC